MPVTSSIYGEVDARGASLRGGERPKLDAEPAGPNQASRMDRPRGRLHLRSLRLQVATRKSSETLRNEPHVVRFNSTGVYV